MAQGNSSNANRYKGEDIDTDGDGSVNDAQSLQGRNPEDLKGMNESEKSTRLAVLNDIAELRAGQSMDVDDYNRIFVDAFVDQSLISNQTNVNLSTGVNGSVSLGQKILGFEKDSLDANWQDFEAEGLDAFSISSSESYSGNKSVVASSTNSDAFLPEIIRDFGIESKPSKLQGAFRINGSGTPPDVGFQMRDSSGNVLLAAQMSPGSDLFNINKETGVKNGGDFNQWFFVEFRNIDYENSTGDIYVDGDLIKEDAEFENNNASGYQELVLIGPYNQDANSYVDDVTIPDLVESGSISSTVKSVESVSETIQIYQDAELNGQDIQYVINDGDGNTETITQSEVGESISVNFTGTNMSIDVEFTGDGTNSAMLNEYGVDF
jgi:hypothetical protein